MNSYEYIYASIYLVLDLIALILFGAFIIGLFKNYFKKEKEHRAFFKSPLLWQPIALILVVLLPILLVNFYANEPALDSLEEKIDFDLKYHHYLHVSKHYRDSLKIEAGNYDMHFEQINVLEKYIDEHKDHSKVDSSHFQNVWAFQETEKFYQRYAIGISEADPYDLFFYDNKGQITVDQRKDIGNLFLALFYQNVGKRKKALQYLKEVTNKEMPYYNFVSGKVYLYRGQFDKAEKFLLKSLELNENEKGSIEVLSILYYYTSETDKLKSLMQDQHLSEDVSFQIKRYLYVETNDFINYWSTIFRNEITRFSLIGGISAFLIALVWMVYIIRIDIYEKEKWYHLALVVLLSCCTIFFVYPLSDLIWMYAGFFSSDTNAIMDLLHDIIATGMVEEFVKLLPVLLLLKFTKAINEPFDYILYFSLSAIGFAFIENISYIEAHELYNINARSLMSTVAHMAFSSTIAYGMILGKYHKGYKTAWTLPVFFIIAATMHGFYNFWLQNTLVGNYEWVTTIFFIIIVHIWFVYKNNALNISNFYDPEIVVKNDNLKFYLIFSLLGILMFSFAANAFTQGPDHAKSFVVRNVFFFGYFILYFAFSFSRYKHIKGFLSPITIPISLLFPRAKKVEDLSEKRTVIHLSKTYRLKQKYTYLQHELPAFGKFEKRVVVEGNINSYLLRLDTNIQVGKANYNHAIILPKKNKRNADNPRFIAYLLFPPSEEILENHFLSISDFTFVGWVICSIEEDTLL